MPGQEHQHILNLVKYWIKNVSKWSDASLTREQHWPWWHSVSNLQLRCLHHADVWVDEWCRFSGKIWAQWQTVDNSISETNWLTQNIFPMKSLPYWTYHLGFTDVTLLQLNKLTNLQTIRVWNKHIMLIPRPFHSPADTQSVVQCRSGNESDRVVQQTVRRVWQHSTGTRSDLTTAIDRHFISWEKLH